MMSDKTDRYTPELKRPMGGPDRSGTSSASASKEFSPSAWTIGLWFKHAARGAGTEDVGLSSAEGEELMRLRLEDRPLKGEREILSKAAA